MSEKKKAFYAFRFFSYCSYSMGSVASPKTLVLSGAATSERREKRTFFEALD